MKTKRPRCPRCNRVLAKAREVGAPCLECGIKVANWWCEHCQRHFCRPKPAPEAPAEEIRPEVEDEILAAEKQPLVTIEVGECGEARPRLTPHGRIIHEKNTIDVSGFPYPRSGVTTAGTLTPTGASSNERGQTRRSSERQ